MVFSGFMRRRAIRTYAKKLGPLLRRRYGRSGSYTAGQIRTTIERERLPANHMVYAYAMFMDQPGFDAAQTDLGPVGDYEATRQEIGDLCFGGNSSFSAADLASYGSASHGGSADGGFDGGGGAGGSAGGDGGGGGGGGM